MPELNVPDAYRAALRALANADDGDAAHLLEAVAALEPYTSVPTIQRTATDAMGRDGADIIVAMLSIYPLARTMPEGELSDALGRSADLDLPDNRRSLLGKRAEALLNSASLSTTSVAVDLQTQHQRNFQGARIFTDLRPVFAEGMDDPPTGAVIVEMLELQTWGRDGQADTTFIALDEHDLVQLRRVIDRAMDKTRTLRGFLEANDLTYFRLDDPTD